MTPADAQNPLLVYARNVHSQCGEDGIIGEILTRIGVMDDSRTKWCVEFGAWDGIHLSNTYHLINDHGWSAVLIEGEAKRHAQLCRNIPQDNVVKICRFVGFEAHDNLDAIFADTPLPEDFDFLSIDIDGCDWHVWDSMKNYRPKVVCIEYNETVPVDLDYVQPRDFNVKIGNGCKAMDNLAHAKGYTTVCLTRTNVIAVRNDLVDLVLPAASRPTIEDMANPEARRFVWVGMDGSVQSNFDRLPTYWHPMTIDMEDMQVIPRWLRKYSGFYTPVHWGVFGALEHWRKLRRRLRR